MPRAGARDKVIKLYMKMIKLLAMANLARGPSFFEEVSTCMNTMNSLLLLYFEFDVWYEKSSLLSSRWSEEFSLRIFICFSTLTSLLYMN